jgi:hypothetical protein
MATSSLSGAALQASRAALSAALADQPPSTLTSAEEGLEPGEIQEVNMEAQAEGIRTVFSDPTNFNVKVSHQNILMTRDVYIVYHLAASPLLALDTLV